MALLIPINLQRGSGFMGFLLKLWIFFSCCSAPLDSYAQPREYDLKAVLLFNLAQFTEWPENVFAGTNAPLVIGIFGTDPFGKVLDEVVQGESVKGHAIQLARVRSMEQASQCHILFISRSAEDSLSSILHEMEGRPVLTVSDIEGFATRGGMIRFETIGNRIKLKVNVETMQAAKLELSSKVLRLAEVVGRKD